MKKTIGLVNTQSPGQHATRFDLEKRTYLVQCLETSPANVIHAIARISS